MKKSSIPDFSYQWNWQQCLVPWGLARAPPVWADLLIPRSLFDWAQMTSSLPHHHTWMISWHLQYNFQSWLGLCYIIYTMVFIHICTPCCLHDWYIYIYIIYKIYLSNPPSYFQPWSSKKGCPTSGGTCGAKAIPEGQLHLECLN